MTPTSKKIVGIACLLAAIILAYAAYTDPLAAKAFGALLTLIGVSGIAFWWPIR